MLDYPLGNLHSASLVGMIRMDIIFTGLQSLLLTQYYSFPVIANRFTLYYYFNCCVHYHHPPIHLSLILPHLHTRS